MCTAPAPTTTVVAASASATKFFSPAPAAHTTPTLLVEDIAPAPAIYAAPTPVIVYMTPAPAVEVVIATTPADGFIAPALASLYCTSGCGSSCDIFPIRSVSVATATALTVRDPPWRTEISSPLDYIRDAFDRSSGVARIQPQFSRG